MLDISLQAKHDMMVGLINTILEDPSHVPALYGLLMKRQQVTPAAGVTAGETFTHCTTFKSLESSWKIDFLTSASDLELDDLQKAM